MHIDGGRNMHEHYDRVESMFYKYLKIIIIEKKLSFVGTYVYVQIRRG